MINLDSNDPQQVVSKTELEIDLAQNEKMYVLSGIALPEWVLTDDDHDYTQDVYVNLRKSVKDVEQSTVTVGLSSIENSHSSYLFAADEADIQQDPVSQELILHVKCAGRGDVTKFHRFSYQAVVRVTTQVTGISGRITWPTNLFDGSGFTDVEAAQSFHISANVITYVPPVNGGFGQTITKQVATGSTGAVRVMPEIVEVPYQIVGAPYGQPLTVLINVTAPFPVQLAATVQIDGPSPITITPVMPGVGPVDFEVYQQRAVK
jgi:hypothetical protein